MPPPPRPPPPPPPPMQMQQQPARGGGDDEAPPGEELPPGVGGAAAAASSLPLPPPPPPLAAPPAPPPPMQQMPQPARPHTFYLGGPPPGQPGFPAPQVHAQSQQQQQQRRAEEGQLLAQLQLQPRVAALFRPPPPLEHLPPFALSRRKRNARAPGVVPRVPMSGIAAFVKEFEEKEGKREVKDAAVEEEGGDGGGERRSLRHPVLALQARLPPRKTSSGMLLPPLERRSARLEAARARNEEKRKIGIAGYNPKEDPNAAGTDPYRTLFVARLPFDVDEATLRGEFEEFGPVSRVSIVVPKVVAGGGGASLDGGDDGEEKKTTTTTAAVVAATANKKSGNNSPPASRGYAFVEFERVEDMKAAYKRADGRRISSKGPAGSSRRVLVDVERGRTVEGWLPRRLGGGKGGGSEARRAPREPTGERKRKWLGLVQLPRRFYTQRKLAALAPERPPSSSAALPPPPPPSSSSRYGDRGGGASGAPPPWERGSGGGGGAPLPPPPQPPSSRGGGDDDYDRRRDRGGSRREARRSRSRSPRDRDRNRDRDYDRGGGSRRDRGDRGGDSRSGIGSARRTTRSRSRSRDRGPSSRGGRGLSPPRSSVPPPPPPARRGGGGGSEDEEEGELK